MTSESRDGETEAIPRMGLGGGNWQFILPTYRKEVKQKKIQGMGSIDQTCDREKVNWGTWHAETCLDWCYPFTMLEIRKLPMRTLLEEIKEWKGVWISGQTLSWIRWCKREDPRVATVTIDEGSIFRDSTRRKSRGLCDSEQWKNCLWKIRNVWVEMKRPTSLNIWPEPGEKKYEMGREIWSLI